MSLSRATSVSGNTGKPCQYCLSRATSVSGNTGKACRPLRSSASCYHRWMIRLVIFDLDGTLIDSKLDIAHAVNASRRLMNLPDLSLEQISSYVGDGAPMLMRRALG